MKTEYFDKEKREKALKWVEEKWSNACECCGSGTWSLADDLVMLPPFTVGGNIYPHILIMCNNCSNAKLFNAVLMGLVVEKPKDKEKKKEKIIDKKIKIFCLFLIFIILYLFSEFYC